MDLDLLGSVMSAVRQGLKLRGARSEVLKLGPHALHHYIVEGERPDAPPALLVHGLGGSANGFFRTFYPLARRFSRVVAVDLPGHGFSPASQLTLAEHPELLRLFLEKLFDRANPPLVVGNSLGAAVSATVASADPRAMRGLVMVCPAGAKVAPERMEALLKSFSELRTDEQARAITRRLFHRTPLPLLLLPREMKKLYCNPTVQALVADALLNGDSISPEVLRGVSIPLLLLWGASEKLLPFEGIEYFRSHVPAHAEVEIVNGFGHIPQLERPSEVVKRVIAFTDKVLLPG
jgi:pimeloyl-ACP methyl ester carboxylesterase